METVFLLVWLVLLLTAMVRLQWVGNPKALHRSCVTLVVSLVLSSLAPYVLMKGKGGGVWFFLFFQGLTVAYGVGNLLAAVWPKRWVLGSPENASAAQREATFQVAQTLTDAKRMADNQQDKTEGTE